MTQKVFALDTKPGIQRDGTVFDKEFYNDGRWVRFQRGRPRKIAGYREIVNDMAGPSRGIYVLPENNFNYIYNGYSDGMQLIPINNIGIGSGITDITLTDFTPSANNLWQFDSLFDAGGSGNELLVAHPGQNLSLIDSTINTPVLAGPTTGTTMSAIGVFTIAVAGSGYTNGTYLAQPLTGGTGSGATADIVVAGGIVTSVTIVNRGTGYTVSDNLSANIPAGSGFILFVNTLMDFTSLWQHEVGTDAVQGGNSNAIESYFETNDLGWVSGGPSQPSPVGENRWLRIERVEPDFIQTGDMELYITGRPFAQSTDETSDPFVFSPGTNKIDMKEQRRELRLKFVSNVSSGDYQLGKVLLNATIGDVRGY